jgi:uncharacterized protein YfaS (alpha-2-macroglobulin family)
MFNRRFPYLRLFFCGLLLVISINACQNIKMSNTGETIPTRPTQPVPLQPANIPTSNPQPLAEVLPLSPPQLPQWMRQVGPLGAAQPTSQIVAIFQEPLIPLESIDSPAQQDKLKYFQITPPIEGQFRFLTPRMIGFQPANSLPLATRYQVTIKSGLTDLKNNILQQDIAWTFNTEEIKLTNLPTYKIPDSDQINYIETKPSLKFTANVPLDLKSAETNIVLKTDDKNNQSIPVKVIVDPGNTSEEEEERESATVNNKNPLFNYLIQPAQELAKETTYKIEFAAGLKPVYGNLPSQTAFVTQVKTYAPLAFKDINHYGKPDAYGAYGRFTEGAPELEFNNPLNVESALQNITINPPPAKDASQPIRAYEDSNTVIINPWALEPNTNYTITLSENLTDVFGQKLEKPLNITYQTTDLAAEITAPDGLHIFPSDLDLQLNINAVNLPNNAYKSAYQVVKPTDLIYFSSAYPQEGGRGLLPDVSQWQNVSINQPAKNQVIEEKIPIREKLNAPVGMLAYGIQGRTNQYIENGEEKWREPTDYGLVQLTNLGVFSQWFPELGMIQVNQLSDGSPVIADIEVYPSLLDDKEKTAAVQACATGKTNTDGTLIFTAENLANCMQGDRFAKAPKLLVIAKKNDDWAFARVEEYSGSYGYGIYANWQENQPQSRGTIFSDRQLYKPGETALLTGVAYYLADGKIQVAKNTDLQVTVSDPDDNKTNLGKFTTNDFGTFSVELPLADNQKLGFYYVKAIADNGLEIDGNLRVSEFKVPNFQVNLKVDKSMALAGQSVQATTQSDYLFGAPVGNGKMKYYVTRNQKDFALPNWQEFTFGRQWFWPENPPRVNSNVTELATTLNEQGQNTETFKIAEDIPFPMTYRIDAEVTDLANATVANSRTIEVLPSDKLIGIKSNFVAEATKEFPVEIVVTNPQGEAIAGENLQVALQKMNYSSVTQVIAGSRVAKDQVEYKTVEEQTFKSYQQPVIVKLTPPEPGSYRIRVNLAQATDEVTATDSQIWVTGTGAASWGDRFENNRLEVKLDKPNYNIGDTATALIQSPYSEGQLYFAVIRDKPLYQQTLQVNSSAPEIKFTVTPEMLPNVAVQAVLIRQGQPLQEVEPGTVENLVKIGFAPLQTNLDSQYLEVQITPQQEKLAPGEEATVNLKVLDNQGKPQASQLTVMAVNQAVLQLTDYQLPDLVKTVYAEQNIATSFNDNRPEVALASPTNSKGWGFGGGASNSLGNLQLRENFQPIAYYDGAVMTDAKGEATVKFKLPDDLTTWKIQAIAYANSADNNNSFLFGKGENQLIATKPIATNPILPMFARLGDRFNSGLTVTNNAAVKDQMQITGEVTGGVLQFADNKTTVSQNASVELGTQSYIFPLEARGIGEASVKFATNLTNQAGDAFNVPLTVQGLTVAENMIETGTTEDQVKIPLNIANNVLPEIGGLEISLANTLIPEITAPVQQLLDQSSLPFLEPAASQLAIASDLQILQGKTGQTITGFDAPKQINQAITKLEQLQQEDGGFSSYPNGRISDPYLTPYAARAIAATLETAPEQVPANMVTNLRKYLNDLLADPGKNKSCEKTACRNQIRLNTLIALDALGDRRNSFLADIYAGRQELDLVSQVKLASYLTKFPDFRQEAETVLGEIQQNIYETGRNTTISLPDQWQWLNSSTVAQAEYLNLLVAQSAPTENIDKALQSLLNLRRKGTWDNTYNNAIALGALVNYLNTQPAPGSFVATAQLGAKELQKIQFQQYTKPTTNINIAMDNLPKGNNDLTLSKTGEGTLHYLVSYKYRLAGEQPGRINGLRVSRHMKLVNSDQVNTISLNPPSSPLNVNTGQVFDIAVEIVADHPVDHVLINDPLPAGLEAIDASLQTSTAALQAQADSWQIGYQQIYKDRIEAYSDRLEPGIYTLHYLARSVTPGEYIWPGSEARLQYAPEEFGRSATARLVVK